MQIIKKTFKLKQSYTSHIRLIEDQFNLYLHHLFECLDLGLQKVPFDISKWDISTTEIMFIQDSPKMIQLLSGIGYLQVLHLCPSLTRLWFNSCRNRQLTLSLSAYTQQYFSKIIIEEELKTIDIVEGILVSIIKGSVNEVTFKYVVEECTLMMTIKLPLNYPLRQVEISGIGLNGF